MPLRRWGLFLWLFESDLRQKFQPDHQAGLRWTCDWGPGWSVMAPQTKHPAQVRELHCPALLSHRVPSALLASEQMLCVICYPIFTGNRTTCLQGGTESKCLQGRLLGDIPHTGSLGSSGLRRPQHCPPAPHPSWPRRYNWQLLSSQEYRDSIVGDTPQSLTLAQSQVHMARTLLCTLGSHCCCFPHLPLSS